MLWVLFACHSVVQGKGQQSSFRRVMEKLGRGLERGGKGSHGRRVWG